MMQMLKRAKAVCERGFAPTLLGLVLVGAALACSGPPPPTVTILPTNVSFNYTDVNGDPQTGSQALIDFNNPTDPAGPRYYYCGDASAADSMCFDDATRLAMVEVPAGADVTFGAFQYNPGTGTRTSGAVNPDLSTVQSMINGIAGSSSSMKISEMQSRGSGGAFDMTPPVAGAVPGIKAAMILDWAGIDTSAPDYFPPAPGDYEMDMETTVTLDAPNPSSASGVTTPGGDLSVVYDGYVMGYTKGWTPSEHKWYVQAGTYQGQAEDVVRIVDKHMNGKGLGEIWIHLENEEGTDIDGDGDPNEIGRMHVWVAAGGYTRTNGGRLGLAPGKPPTSSWQFDIPPSSAPWTPYGDFVHLSLHDKANEGIGYPDVAGVNGNQFFHTQNFLTPSEPTGYMVRSDVNIYWAYGNRMPPGGAWEWWIGRKYMGFVDFTGMDISSVDDPTEYAEVNQRVKDVQDQLRCIPSDAGGSGSPYFCDWPAAPAVTSSVFSDELEDVALAGGGPIPMSLFGNFFPGSAPPMSRATSYLHDIPDVTNLTISNPLPAGFDIEMYRYSGIFPQTTRGNGGQPGYAFVIARDIQAPRHATIVGAGGTVDVDAAGNLDPPAETGRLLSDTYGAGQTLDVVVFDDNPGNVAYAALNGAEVYDGSGSPIPASHYNPLLPLTSAPIGSPPQIQVWYTAQKSGWDYQEGTYLNLPSTAIPGGSLATLYNKRGNMFGSDNRLVPSPTFRFYAFRDSGGDVMNYTPVRYDLIERSGEPVGVVMRYSINLDHAREPMGIHFAENSLDHSAAGVDYPAYDPKMMKLFVRAIDGRLTFPSGSSLINTPTDAPWQDYQSGNYAPYFDATNSEHESGFANAIQLFPGGSDVPVDLDSPDPLVPPATHTVVQDAARDFTDHLGNTPFSTIGGATQRFSAAAGIPVRDVVPPTVVLMVTDTKYDQTMFFGNTMLGEMASDAMQQRLRQAYDPGTVTSVDPETDFAGDVTGNTGPPDNITIGEQLFPYFNLGTGMPACPEPYDPAATPCQVQPRPPASAREWFFEYGAGGLGSAGGVTDLAQQLTLLENFAYHPTSYWADPDVLPDDCDAALTSAQCRLTEPRGLWVDEDTRLLFRVVAWDNLNSYKAAHTSAGPYENIEVRGQDTSPSIGGGSGSVDVRIVDAPSGYGTALSLSGAANELQQSWPTYAFRNPNRQGAAGTDIPTNSEAYIEVEYTDPADNKTILRVNFFVMENNMTIRSLQEERLRQMSGE